MGSNSFYHIELLPTIGRSKNMDIYAEITARIITEMEQSRIP